MYPHSDPMSGARTWRSAPDSAPVDRPGAGSPVGTAGSAPSAGDGAPPPMPVKIVVSGGFGVGKTTFIGSLSEIEPLTTEAAMTTAAIGIDHPGAALEKTTTTVAMDFGRITIDSSVILYLFGTPGQDRFGFMWNDLVNGALGGIVLIDTGRIEDSFVAMDYFEKLGLPFVVAVNEFEGRPSVSVEAVREAANVDPDVPVLTVDARYREPVKAVVLNLLHVLLRHAREQHGGRPLTATW